MPSESKHDVGLPEWKAARDSSAALSFGGRRAGASRAMADDDECVELAVEEDDEEIDMTQYVEEARREKKRTSLEDRAKAALAGPRDLQELDADFLASYEGEALHPTAPPNFLRVGLHSAQNLKAVDSQLFGSEKWSDPQVRFVVKAGKTRGELSATSRVVEKELNPKWKQPFVFAAAPDPDWALGGVRDEFREMLAGETRENRSFCSS